MRPRWCAGLTVLLLVQLSIAAAVEGGDDLGSTQAGDLVWVAVSVLDRGQTESSEYNGQIRRAELETILARTGAGGWLTLERVHWHMDDGITEQSRVGQEWGYGDRSHFPVERITRIIPLTPARVALLEGRLSDD